MKEQTKQGDGEKKKSQKRKKTIEEEVVLNLDDVSRKMKNLGWIIFIGFSLLIVIIGRLATYFYESSWENTVAGLILWITMSLAISLDIVPQKESRTYARFGEPIRVNLSGIHLTCYKGIIDKLVQKIDHKHSPTDIFTGTEGGPSKKIDFTEGTTAELCAETWWRVKETREAILKFIYIVSDPEAYLRNQFDTFIRPRLQVLSADDAQKQKNNIASKIRNELAADIEKVTGIELEPIKGLLITDIKLPEDVIKLRLKKLEGITAAEQDTRRGAGYANAILAILKVANKDKKGDDKLSFDKAREIFERQRGLETLEKTQSNITLIAPDANSILKTIDVAPSK